MNDEPKPIHDSDRGSGREQAATVLYAAASAQWIHSEQVRWTLLYNFLMASTVLLLAWTAVLASTQPHIAKLIVLSALAGGGFIISLLWIALGLRASGFVDTYREAGMCLEKVVGRGLDTPSGPFVRARLHRDALRRVKFCSRHRVERLASSRRVVYIVPAAFTGIYAVLLLLPFFIESPEASLVLRRLTPRWSRRRCRHLKRRGSARNGWTAEGIGPEINTMGTGSRKLQLARRHLDRVLAAWTEPTDWDDLSLYGFYCLEAALEAAALHFGLRTSKKHWEKVDLAVDLHKKNELPDISDLLRDLNDARKAAAYGDVARPDLDAEDIASQIEQYVDAVAAVVAAENGEE